MCGIIGIIDKEKTGVIHAASEKIAHRGPDDNGFFSEKNIALGHRRLSILDLSPRGHQPMISRDGRYVIVFNGEIYNHMELRNKLLPHIVFNSHTDTETILYGYIQYGEEFINKLNGIFAFALYDKLSGDVLLVRDQFGVKPVYYYHKDGAFYFASEIKALAGLGIDKSLDIRAMSSYLYYLYSPGESTPFEYVKKLKPGYFIKLNINNPNQIVFQQYYEIPFTGQYETNYTELNLIEKTESLLTQAVDRQLLSDVPVGFFLSGGLDSAAIVALARKRHPQKSMRCYTIDTGGGFDGFADDLHYAKVCAKHLDVNLEIVKAEINIVQDFDKMIWHLDEPQADAAPLNVYNICQAARANGDIVLLGGTAGDDLFSGYRRHQALSMEPLFSKMPDSIWKLVNKSLDLFSAKNARIRRLKKIASEGGKSTEERMAGYYGWLNYNSVYSLFNKETRVKLDGWRSTDILINSLSAIPKENNNLNKMLFWEMKYFLADHNLNYTDKMSMATGIEVRVPFLDKDLVEFSTRIPPELKMKGKTTKYILKKAMEKHLPAEIIYRPKTGFGAPVRKWITQDLDEMIKTRLSKENIERWGVFDYNAVYQLIQKNKKGQIDAAYSIWSLLAIASWMEQFI